MSIRKKISIDKGMKGLIDTLGFSTKINDTNHNLINKDGSFNIKRKGEITSNFYEHLLLSNWAIFFLEFVLVFCLINMAFALLFLWVGLNQIGGIPEGGSDFWTAFFFSIQTFTTVGYGAMHPTGTAAHVVASASAFSGLVTFAVFTSILYARFSKAKNHIAYSKKMLIAPYQDGMGLMFRVVNKSSNNIINLHANVTMTFIAKENGINRRKFARLPLELSFIYLFPLNWTLVHKIDENSPLYGLTSEQMTKSYTEFLIMISGYDDTYDKNIHSNYSYDAVDIVENASFDVMYESNHDQTTIHLSKLDDYTKL